MFREYGFRAYYAHDVKLPKLSGDLAIDVRWTTESDRDMEASLAIRRPDIGLVEKYTIRPAITKSYTHPLHDSKE